MSEAYFISGCQLPTGSSQDALLQAIFTSAEIKPHQVDEIHMFTDAASALFQRRLETVFGPVIQWPLLPFLPVSTLFSACRALESGEISTCILAENSNQASCAVLLANPDGVGRFNLSPVVQLSTRSVFPEGITDLTASALKLLASIPKDEIEPEIEVPDLRVPRKQPARPWLAVHASEKPVVSDWPEDRLAFSSSLFPGLLKIIDLIQTSKTDPGVWTHSAPNEPGGSMLVLPL
jgi:hypothetical protein